MCPEERGQPRPSSSSRARPVHPRVRGDHASHSACCCASSGSSPRSRGPRARPQQGSPQRRFIPAFAGTTTSDRPAWRAPYGSSPRSRGPLPIRGREPPSWRFIPAFAGTTRSSTVAALRIAVHPRVRGDHDIGAQAEDLGIGSSPRSRGPRDEPQACRRHDRFIPAFAGTTRARHAVRSRGTVHPRVRGDHAPSGTPENVTTGSSPRSRGPRNVREGARNIRRFIPAFAGTTPLPTFITPGITVHPRVRGDHAPRFVAMYSLYGSSPRSRGPQGGRRHRDRRQRFIPAFAGTTRRSARRISSCAVHPRVRGDHRHAEPSGERRRGSSPRSRGPLSQPVTAREGRRFIPAFAGTTCDRGLSRAEASVHPRVRGDHAALATTAGDAAGSSPRSRGPPFASVERRLKDRFIPAFAGTTS